MKREEYVFAAIVFGALICFGLKLKHVSDRVSVTVKDTERLKDESYQFAIDDEFDEIVWTHLYDLYDLGE